MSFIPELLPFFPWVEHLLFVFLSWHFLWHRTHPVRFFLKHTSLYQIQRFFIAISPFLIQIYPLLQTTQAPRGRPPLDQTFQLRWFIWFCLFGEQTLSQSLHKFNACPELQQLLECPVPRYYQSTLTRFLDRVGPGTLRKIHVRLVLQCLKWGLIKGVHLVIDGFPIHSYLSTQQCLKNPKLVVSQCTEFFASISLTKVVDQLYTVGLRGYLLADCLRVFLFEILWNMPSRNKAITTIKTKEGLEAAIRFPRRCPGVATYRNFVAALEALPTFREVQTELLARVRTSLALLFPADLLKEKVQLGHLRGVMSNPLPAKDAGAKLNYCASKKMTYWGRGGLILCDAESELPVFLGIQQDAAISEREFTEFLTQYHASYGAADPVRELAGDGEFAPMSYKTAVKRVLGVPFHSAEPDPQTGRWRLQPRWFLIRLAVERCISRLHSTCQIETPRVIGEQRVGAWVQLGGIVQVLGALAAAQWGRRDKIRSLSFIQG